MASKYYLKSPREQPFYRGMMLIMTSLGLANNQWWSIVFTPKLHLFLTLHGKVAKILCPIVLGSLLLSFVNYKKLSFTTLAIMFSILPVSMVVTVKMASANFKSYEKLMRDFIDKIHLLSFYLKEKDEFILLKLKNVEKYTRRTAYFLFVFLGIDWGSWFIIPIINNIHNQDHISNKTVRLQTCLYLWMPFDYSYDYINWVVVHIISGYLSFAGCAIISSFDTINFAFVFNLIGHLEILKHSIKVRFVKKMSNGEQKMRLIEIIKYHAFIIETFKEMQSAFGINVAGNYLQNLLEDSLLIYQLTFANNRDKISFGIMVIVYMGELVLMSFVLEEVRRQSDDLPEVLYSIPWEEMSVSNQKIFKLILLRVQPTLSFVAACGLKAGVHPMMSILKSTFSYYVMIKSSVKS